MKALISPIEEVKYISLWNKGIPIYTVLGKRVAEVTNNEFPVAEPLFWIDCETNITAENYYYNEINKSIIAIPNDVEIPIDQQPKTTGTQNI